MKLGATRQNSELERKASMEVRVGPDNRLLRIEAENKIEFPEKSGLTGERGTTVPEENKSMVKREGLHFKGGAKREDYENRIWQTGTFCVY